MKAKIPSKMIMWENLQLALELFKKHVAGKSKEKAKNVMDLEYTIEYDIPASANSLYDYSFILKAKYKKWFSHCKIEKPSPTIMEYIKENE